MSKTSIAERLKKTGSAAIIETLEKYKAQISQRLPANIMHPDKVIMEAVDAIKRNPDLSKPEIDQGTLIGAVMAAASYGLSPRLGECYFVPRTNGKRKKAGEATYKEVSLDIGYKGYVTLARRSGLIKWYDAHVVRENDLFDYEYGFNPFMKHRPARANRGEITDAYAVFEFTNGARIFRVISREEIEELRLRNPAQTDTYTGSKAPKGSWATDYADMACGKAIKKMKSLLPLSIEAHDEIVFTPESFQAKGDDVQILIPEYAENQEAQVIDEKTDDEN